MLSTDCKLLDVGKPDAVTLDPPQKLLSAVSLESIPHGLIAFEPIAPNPLMQMIGSDRAMPRTARGVTFSHEVVEVFDEHRVEITAGERIKHASLLMRPACGSCGFDCAPLHLLPIPGRPVTSSIGLTLADEGAMLGAPVPSLAIKMINAGGGVQPDYVIVRTVLMGDAG